MTNENASGGGRVSLPIALSRHGVALMYLALIAVAVMSWLGLPAGERWVSATLLLPMVLVAILLVRRGAWLDGTRLSSRYVTSRQVDLSTARVALAPTKVGATVFSASGGRARLGGLTLPGRYPQHYPVLMRTAYLQTHAPSWVCRALADALATNRAEDAGRVRAVLLAQATHLDGGGSPDDSPLALLAGLRGAPTRGWS